MVAPAGKTRSFLAAAAFLSVAATGMPLLWQAGCPSAHAESSTSTDVDIGSSVAQTIYLAVRRPAEAEAYARAVQTPGPLYHAFLSRDAFVARFAPTDADIARVSAVLTRLGYTVGTVFPNHLAIQVTSTAGTAETTFGVRLHRMHRDGRSGMVPTGTISIPSSLRDVVRGIGGLDTLRVAHPMRALPAIDGQSTRTRASATATLTGGKGGYYLPQDFATRYGVDALYRAGYTGKGSTIGILTLANFHSSDAYAFWKAIGLSVRQDRITTVSVDGGSDVAASRAAGEGETDLDIEQSGGLAPDASLRVYVAPNETNANFIDVFEAAASENIADTLSVSWGQPELNFFAEPSKGIAASTDLLDAFHDVFLEMAIQGQSLFAASGDSGAFDTVRSCRVYGTPSADAPVCNAPYAVESPANDPAITAAGGTTLPLSLTLSSGAILSVTEEQAWSWNYVYEQTAAQGQPLSYDSLFATGDGGGVSAYFRRPPYQRGVSGMQNTKTDQSLTEDTGSGAVTLLRLPGNFPGRNVPDLSANADPESGYQVLEEGDVVTFQGGTSFVAPQFNGVAALLVQRIGGRVGLLNTVLYGLGTLGSDDITAGDNWGYEAARGYEPATGIGVLNASRLGDALAALKAIHGR